MDRGVSKLEMIRITIFIFKQSIRNTFSPLMSFFRVALHCVLFDLPSQISSVRGMSDSEENSPGAPDLVAESPVLDIIRFWMPIFSTKIGIVSVFIRITVFHPSESYKN